MLFIEALNSSLDDLRVLDGHPGCVYLLIDSFRDMPIRLYNGRLERSEVQTAFGREIRHGEALFVYGRLRKEEDDEDDDSMHFVRVSFNDTGFSEVKLETSRIYDAEIGESGGWAVRCLACEFWCCASQVRSHLIDHRERCVELPHSPALSLAHPPLVPLSTSLKTDRLRVDRTCCSPCRTRRSITASTYSRR